LPAGDGTPSPLRRATVSGRQSGVRRQYSRGALSGNVSSSAASSRSATSSRDGGRL
jgi:hypothetical protein